MRTRQGGHPAGNTRNKKNAKCEQQHIRNVAAEEATEQRFALPHEPDEQIAGLSKRVSSGPVKYYVKLQSDS